MSTFKDLYNTAKEAEDVAFAVSPIPLGFIKSGIQNVGVPLVVAAAATHTPFVAPLAGTAIKWGSDAFQSGTHSLAQQAMSNFGESVMSGLPAFGGIQTSFNWISSESSQVILAGQDMVTHAVGSVGTSLMLGRTVANSAVVAFQKIRPMTINEILANGQQALERSQEFLTSVASHIRQIGIHAELFVEQEFAKLSNSEEQTTQVQPTESPEQATVLAMDKTQVEAEPQLKAAAQVESNGTQPEINVQPSENGNGQSERGTQANIFEAAVETAANMVNPIRSESSQEAEDYVLGLVDKLAAGNMNVDRLYIKMDGIDIFKMKNGAPDPSTSITDSQRDALQQALEDPAAFGGNLVIKQGNKVLLNIKKGRILHNPMGLAKQSLSAEMETKEHLQQQQPEAKQATVPNNPAEGLWSKYGANVSPGLKGVKLAADNALKDGIKPKEVRAMLGQSAHFKGLTADKGASVAEKVIARTVKTAQARVAQQQRPKQKVQQKEEQKQAAVMAPGL
ncbi:hypothetical protein [Acaryochloris marina]|uniref:Uncharacterized protein n=1 Tax=Acaryochloris marina (strain MBIC 11017) TaxID=329726 RepID=A8ZQI7_ACAM1|nr:hypothetical protein [Acaryochloris marina]ABW33273.1 hypothetical protein AM1_G0093 [Acaryochloris marina MBIC11017]